MALDTTIGAATAVSYATEAEYIAYAAAMGWTLSGDNEVNLRQAAKALDANNSFVGVTQYQFQARAWPRLWTGLVRGWSIDPDTIPQPIKDAQCEMAYLIQGGADPLATIDGLVKRKREKLDVIEEETEYFGGQGKPSYPAVTRLLRGYIIGGPGQAAMVRG